MKSKNTPIFDLVYDYYFKDQLSFEKFRSLCKPYKKGIKIYKKTNFSKFLRANSKFSSDLLRKYEEAIQYCKKRIVRYFQNDLVRIKDFFKTGLALDQFDSFLVSSKKKTVK